MKVVMYIAVAFVSLLIGTIAETGYAHYWGWPSDYGMLDPQQQKMVDFIRWGVAAVSFLVLGIRLQNWWKKRNAPTIGLPFIVIGGAAGPVRKPRNRWGNVLFVLLLLFLVVFYTMKEMNHP